MAKEKGSGSVDTFSKINLIEKISKMLNKYGYKNVLSSLFIFISFITVIIIFANQKVIVENIIKNQQQETKETEMNSLKFRITEVNPRVDAILYKLLVETKADRAYVMEMHNGTDNPTGMPFVFGHMTYEKMANENTPSVIYQYDKINLSALTFPNYLIKNKYFIGGIDELKKIDSKLYFRVSENNIKYIAIYSIRTIDVEIGAVGISFFDDSNINKNKIESSLIDASQKLSILLDITKNIEGT